MGNIWASLDQDFFQIRFFARSKLLILEQDDTFGSTSEGDLWADLKRAGIMELRFSDKRFYFRDSFESRVVIQGGH
jgi:hypothetical protein